MNREPHPAERRYFIATALFFLISRIPLYRFVEFRFDRLGESMQLLDPEILRNDLFNGLQYLHVQPPLYNLFTGLFLKMVPEGIQSITLALLYSLLGLLITLGTYRLIRLRGIRPVTACIVAAALSVSPIMVWGERVPSYLYPIVALLVGAALLLWKFAETKRTAYGILFLVAVGLLPLTRSFFHLIFWMAPVIAGVLFLAFRIDRKRFAGHAITGGIFLAAVFGVYLKNAAGFGSFTGSTWQGMNVAGVVSLTPPEKVRRLVEEGKATPLALVPRFSPPGVYYRYYNLPVPEGSSGSSDTKGVPALDDTVRSTGFVNWNNRIYAQAAREYQRNAVAVAKAYPFQVVRGLLNGTWLFCSFYTYKLFNDPDRWWIPDTGSPVRTAADIGLVYIIPFFLALVVGLTVLRFLRTCRVVVRQRKAAPEQRRHLPGLTVLDLFTGFTVLYTAVIAVAAELGEQSLMRGQVEPFLAVTVAIGAERFFRRRQSQRAKKKQGSTSVHP